MKYLLNMKMPILWGVVVAGFLQGCIPGPVRYWAPTADGARAVNTHCGTAAAPASTLEYSSGKVLMHVEAKDNHARLDLVVPDGSSVKFGGVEISIKEAGIEKKSAISDAHSYSFHRKMSLNQNPLEPMVGETRHLPFGGTESRRYRLFADYPMIQGNDFSLTLPKMVVDGLEFKALTIFFTKKTGVGLMPINC